MRLFSFKSLCSLLLGTFVASCNSDTIDQKLPSETIATENKVFEIQVLPGSFATNDCGMSAKDLETDQYACVAFPFASKSDPDKNWDSDYLQELSRNGWEWAGGEGNAYYLEKKQSEECSYFLAMVGWLQGSEEEVKRYFNEGELGNIVNQTYIFALNNELVCGNKRRAE